METLEILIDRAWRKADYTISRLYVDGERFYEALEDKDRGLDQTMPVGKINQMKVYGKTAIPRGTYEVILSVSPKFKSKSWAKKWGGRTPEILGVKGYAGVRIHPGNTDKDSLGCVLVGRNTAPGKLTESTMVYGLLMEKIVAATKAGKKITLVIK